MNLNRTLRHRLLTAVAGYLAEPVDWFEASATATELAPRLQAGDIILVRGNTRLARFVAALTGSRWTHVAICIRDVGPAFETSDDWIVEADLVDGVRRVSLDGFAGQELLVLRPAGLDAGARRNLVSYLQGRLGNGYDLSHIIGLARLLVARRFRTPIAWARQLRPADPARAICSTLAARALEAAGLAIAIAQPIATSGAGLSLDHLVPGDFEHAAGMMTVFDSRSRALAPYPMALA
jgi:hypothetical protein